MIPVPDTRSILRKTAPVDVISIPDHERAEIFGSGNVA
jgi:hypothetical protein